MSVVPWFECTIEIRKFLGGFGREVVCTVCLACLMFQKHPEGSSSLGLSLGHYQAEQDKKVWEGHVLSSPLNWIKAWWWIENFFFFKLTSCPSRGQKIGCRSQTSFEWPLALASLPFRSGMSSFTSVLVTFRLLWWNTVTNGFNWPYGSGIWDFIMAEQRNGGRRVEQQLRAHI